MTQILARGLVAAGHQVRVAGYYAGAARPAFEEDLGVKVWRWREPAHRGGWMVARWRLFTVVSEWMRAGTVDVLEVPDWEGWAAWWPALPAPVITRLNGSISYFAAEMQRSPRWLPKILEGASLRRSDFWCSVSRYTADRTQELFGLRHGPDAILHNPVNVDDSPSSDSPRSRHDVIFTGTLTAKKGIVSLIDAWPAVCAALPDSRLHVYGKDGRTEDGGSMQAFLNGRLPEKLRPQVQFHGHVAHDLLLTHLRRARVAVFPSYAEACAIAPLEAMACGCPTISTVRGSGPELLRDGQDGLLVDPADTTSIASALVRLLTDDSVAQKLGAAGRRHVAGKFSTRTLIEQNVGFYRTCVDRFRHTPAVRDVSRSSRSAYPSNSLF